MLPLIIIKAPILFNVHIYNIVASNSSKIQVETSFILVLNYINHHYIYTNKKP